MQSGEESVARERLAQVSGGVAPERSQDVIRGVLDGHDDHRDLGVTIVEQAKEREAIHAGHQDVDEQHVVGVRIESRECFLAIGGAVGFPSGAHEHGLNELVNGRIVIYDEEPVWLLRWHFWALNKDT